MGDRTYSSPPPPFGAPVGSPPVQYQQNPQQPQPIYDPYPQQQQVASAIPAAGVPVLSRPWEYGFFDCFDDMETCPYPPPPGLTNYSQQDAVLTSTGCLGFWCPCVLFGRTHARVVNPSAAPDSINGYCFSWAAICLGGVVFGLPHGCMWILQMFNREDIRSKYRLDGSSCGDYVRSFWCWWCALCQEEKEVASRNRELLAMNRPQQGYQPVPQMVYPG
jgi:Cys-rich protein (TIGR01571 family)